MFGEVFSGGIEEADDPSAEAGAFSGAGAEGFVFVIALGEDFVEFLGGGLAFFEGEREFLAGDEDGGGVGGFVAADPLADEGGGAFAFGAFDGGGDAADLVNVAVVGAVVGLPELLGVPGGGGGAGGEADLELGAGGEGAGGGEEEDEEFVFHGVCW